MSPDERAALEQCAAVFAEKRDIVFIVPESLDCSVYLKVIPSAAVKCFDDSYFTGISSYSRLLLTPDFYHCFEEYTHMLIYQLDGWVFRDELDEWCGKEYEYIGAPFFLQDGKKRLPVAGNGGVSLRNIAAMLRVLSSPEKKDVSAETALAVLPQLRCRIPLFALSGTVVENDRISLQYPWAFS